MTDAPHTYCYLGVDGRLVALTARPHSPLKQLAEIYRKPLSELSGDGHGRPAGGGS